MVGNGFKSGPLKTQDSSLKRILIGDALASSQIIHERLSKIRALAIFSSDALSSVAYATEEIMLVLAAAGTIALSYSRPVSLGIAALLLVVGISYYQTIHAYPRGGGAYIVAKDNLGVYPGLVAGASLLIDYVLTVAVSTSAGVAAVTSWLPQLLPYRTIIAVGAVAMVTMINLRGLRESATVFSIPTYLFIIGIFALLLYGLIQFIVQGHLPQVEVSDPIQADLVFGGFGVFLLLRAYSAGCTALTGIEAISDGVPAFQPPEAKNASRTLLVMIVLLASMFLGITFLANAVGAVPSASETILSQIGRSLFGDGPLYISVQVVTALILLLAANTAFSDFPRLSYFMARDGYLPRQMTNLGDRLVYSNGIALLGILASLLIVLFQGDTHSLLPLYAVGVFISFTLSQSGMVRRWSRLRTPSWRRNMILNAVGALTTLVVFGIILITRFLSGAWIVVTLIPILILIFLRINRHYREVSRALSLDEYGKPHRVRIPQVILLMGGVHRGVLKALEFSRSLSPDVTAVYVEVSKEEGDQIRKKWEQWGDGVRLVCVPSPYRSILIPVLDYLNELDRYRQPDEVITVVIPQFIPEKWWENLLHNQAAWMIRLALFMREGFTVIDVPYPLAKPSQERGAK